MDDVTDVSSVSFVDDGLDFNTRAPTASSWSIGKWADAIEDSASIAGHAISYFDDGADLLPSSGTVPGFGNPDPKFYEQPQRKKRSTNYHDGLRKAVTGDIKDTLKQIKKAGKIQPMKVRRGKTYTLDMVEKSEKPPGVKIKLPKRQPTFVVHGEEGRVVVVDNEGDVIDSGPTRLLPPPPPRRKTDQAVVIRSTKDEAKENGRDERLQDVMNGPIPNRDSPEDKSKQHDNQKRKSNSKQDSPTQPADNPWTTYLETHDATSDYKAPRVEKAPDTPKREKKGRRSRSKRDSKSNGKDKFEK